MDLLCLGAIPLIAIGFLLLCTWDMNWKEPE